MKVDFVGIAASRSGSTWLSTCLAEHPAIAFSSRKEVHFFDRDALYKRGESYYHSFFSPTDQQITGEFTPGYFSRRVTAPRIYEYHPGMKLLVVLRDPVDRAYSEYLFNFARELETLPSFEEALEGPRKNRYIKRGEYARLLTPFLKRFPFEQFFFTRYDDIVVRPATVVKDVYAFLGVDSDYLPQALLQTINSSRGGSSVNYIPGLNKMIVRSKRFAQHPFLQPLKMAAKAMHVPQLLQRVRAMNTHVGVTNSASFYRPPLDASIEKRLRNHYRSDLLELQQITGVDVSNWL